MSNYAVVEKIPWTGQAAFQAAKLQPLLVTGAETGQVKSEGPLTWAQIESSGHMVPQDNPPAAAWVLNDIISAAHGRK